MNAAVSAPILWEAAGEVGLRGVDGEAGPRSEFNGEPGLRGVFNGELGLRARFNGEPDPCRLDGEPGSRAPDPCDLARPERVCNMGSRT